MQCNNRVKVKISGEDKDNGPVSRTFAFSDLTHGLVREPDPQFPVGDAHNMTVSWHRRLRPVRARLGVNSMMVALLIAGIGLLLAGLVTLGFGILIDLSLGNTLILAGAVVACTGLILLGLWMVIRELQNIARQLGSGVPATAVAGAQGRDLTPEKDEFLFGHDQPAAENSGQAEPGAPPPWLQESGSRDRGRVEPPAAPEPVAPAPAVKPKRNLLFSSSSRKERERAEARAAEPPAADLRTLAAAPPPAPEPSVAPPATFDDAWPQSERARGGDVPPQRRSVRTPSTFTAPNPGVVPTDPFPPAIRAPRNEEQPPVTVLKSGVVDGMAYSLYSDGSIEAQMPEGMMRFASIDELRSHLDQRP
jgi:hypothetical protein